ncbi:probable crossover junction endonuclease EME2 isoform X5 [Choloepus didactylus]|uniref:probable crossover junction endonuclease EME2 isoform X5 n=1 Tax=Choloepus didactylus TaxID=27675 RepID=UPI00189F6BCC|nr:probable crossover junction endonuclease EME2 isoform X5 [Choloepus didactylus]
MAGAGPGRAGGSFRGQGRGRGREQRRPPTWEISDSDAEGPVRAEAAARAPDPAEERRAAAEALRLLRPERALRRLAVRVDPAILQDAGADTLMEALGALGCEYLIEPQPQARSLRWSRVRPDPCPRGVPPEVWAENEQEVLLLLEPGEFLRGIARLPKVLRGAGSSPQLKSSVSRQPRAAGSRSQRRGAGEGGGAWGPGQAAQLSLLGEVENSQLIFVPERYQARPSAQAQCPGFGNPEVPVVSPARPQLGGRGGPGVGGVPCGLSEAPQLRGSTKLSFPGRAARAGEEPAACSCTDGLLWACPSVPSANWPGAGGPGVWVWMQPRLAGPWPRLLSALDLS